MIEFIKDFDRMLRKASRITFAVLLVLSAIKICWPPAGYFEKRAERQKTFYIDNR